jgi:hypothetical protein
LGIFHRLGVKGLKYLCGICFKKFHITVIDNYGPRGKLFIQKQHTGREKTCDAVLLSSYMNKNGDGHLSINQLHVPLQT